MKNILVIDINEFMPFITELFDVDYYSNLNINTEKTYDWVFISFPIEDTFLYSKFGFTSIQNETKCIPSRSIRLANIAKIVYRG